jgi:fluoride exporter
MNRFLLVCLAGAAGTAARYLLTLWTGRYFGSAFPYGTLIVNLAGCFAITALAHAGASLVWSPTLRTVLAVGFLGGLTTYSTFNYESTRLVQEGAFGTAAANVGLTVIGGFFAGWFGLLCARYWLGQS